MKVFISWSGDRSRECAEIFADWLPKVIQSIEPWISTDIEKGSRWTPEISETLNSSRVGIICLTRENLDNKWILFEAGALSKIPETRVCTFLLGLKPTDVKEPLSQFMHTVFSKEDIFKLLLAINSEIGKSDEKPLPEKTLNSVFDMFWTEFEQRIGNIKSKDQKNKSQIRTDRDILEEILDLVRKSDNLFRKSEKYSYSKNLREPVQNDFAIFLIIFEDAYKTYNQLIREFGLSEEEAIYKTFKKLNESYILTPELKLFADQAITHIAKRSNNKINELKF